MWGRLVLLVALSLLVSSAVGFGCLSPSGHSVDWWIVYKLPDVRGNPTAQNGFGFAYTDPHTHLKITGETLETSGALGVTLKQIYHGTFGYIMWNDETPDGKTSSSKAHSKGVMGWDLTGGFLLRHSTPRFPPDRSSGYNGLPSNEKIYGQTYICTSVNLPTLNSLAGQYLTADIQVYDSHAMAGTSSFTNLSRLVEGREVSGVSSQILPFKTVGGTLMYDFVKSRHCECDLWDSIIANFYNKGMSVLTWGRPLEPSGCPPETRHKVTNIKNINWGSISYKETEEHSKWGITSDANVVCIGDINRMISQRKRGGGATCFTSPTTAGAFQNLIADIEPC